MCNVFFPCLCNDLLIADAKELINLGNKPYNFQSVINLLDTFDSGVFENTSENYLWKNILLCYSFFSLKKHLRSVIHLNKVLQCDDLLLHSVLKDPKNAFFRGWLKAYAKEYMVPHLFQKLP
jgi:hypothetical protein